MVNVVIAVVVVFIITNVILSSILTMDTNIQIMVLSVPACEMEMILEY